MTVTADDRHTLAGAYALDAIDDVERRAFERHLETCAACVMEVAELTATAAYLGVAVAMPAPPDLRRRVLADIVGVRQLPPQPTKMRRLHGVSRRAATLLSAAAAVLAALAISLGVIAYQADQRADRLAAEADRLADQSEQVAALLAAPDVENAVGDVAGGGLASVVASEERGEVLLLTQDLPELDADSTYQMWLIGDAIASAGVLDVPSDGDLSFLTDGDLGGVTTIALSVEPEGGSEQPTTTPIFAGELG
ncbi:MAG: anti-sigma factor [Jiangellaceae bacterium]